ncbi:MAG: NAD(+)/NADH kinase [Ruminococcaceae bacterium]|nr:NAD(+)/NADH kinase [Oscillospiraceae bacterium]
MNKPIKKVFIVTNFNIYDKAMAALNVAERLLSLGCDIFTLPHNKDKIARVNKNKRDLRFQFVAAEDVYETVDAVVVLGGDGTILDAARRAAPAGIPVLGLNLGRLGYLAELETGDLSMLSRFICGDYRLEERSMINVEVLDVEGNVRKSEYALNDAVISNGSISRIVDLELYEGGVAVASYRSDGMIVSTPTGSTAYSLAAGGAIVDPRLDCLCVTPICPHSLHARPIVFPDCARIEIKNVCQREKTLFLTIDGRINHEIYIGERVRVTRSEIHAHFIRLKDSSFYERLRQKMNDI